MTTDAVVAWFKAKWDSGTLDCGCPVEKMNHGWRDAEIDQNDPNAEPFFPENWRLRCSVHNSSKSNSTPEDYAARQRGWELFRESRENRPAPDLQSQLRRRFPPIETPQLFILKPPTSA